MAAGARARPLHQQVIRVGQVALRRSALARKEIHQLVRGRRLEAQRVQFAPQRALVAVRQHPIGDLQELPHAPGEVIAARRVFRAPKRRGGGFRACIAHQHLARRDAPDAPRLTAQAEGLSDGRLPHELLVQLADGGAAVGVAQGEAAAVGNGAAGGVEREQRALARLHGLPLAIKRQARAQVADAGAGVATGQHLHYEVEVFARQCRVRPGAGDQRVERVRLPLLRAGARDQRLRQHVEWIRQRREWLDVALAHRFSDDRGVQKILSEGGEQAAAAHFAHAMPGAAHAL